MRPWQIAVVTVVLLAQGAQAQGTLRIGDPKVESDQVVIPVYLSGNVGNGVAAMDFRVNYDPRILRPVSVTAGAAAADADKRVMANETASGEYVVVMMGMNQTTFKSGEVAQIVMERTSGADDSQWKLGLSQPTLSGTDGTIIESKVEAYTPSTPGTKPDDKTDVTPEKPDTKSTTDNAANPATDLLGVNTPQGQVLVQSRGKPGRTKERQDSTGQQAIKQLQDALDARDEARGAIGTPAANSEAAGQVGGVEPAETDNVPGETPKENRAVVANAGTTEHLVAGHNTVESMRSNPEGRASASRVESKTDSPNAARKAIAAGFAAGAVVAALSLVVLRRKVVG